MKILDKGINKALNWESIDTTIPEMVNLIQTEILENAGEKDLRKLEKGMRKRWVLAIGHGDNIRYYPSAISPVRLCLQFSIITHQLYQISLLDSVNKKEYYIPNGKAACTQLQRAVLRRMTKYNYEKTGSEHRSGTGGKFLNQKEKAAKPDTGGNNLYTAVAGIFVCIACLVLVSHTGLGDLWTDYQLSKNKPNIYKGTSLSEREQDKAVALVQNGYLGEYTDITVKEIFDTYYGMLYENSSWESGTTDSGTTIVQVRYYDKSIESEETTIQFTMLNNECFEITAFVDPLEPIEKTTDLLAALNSRYVIVTVGEVRATAADSSVEREYMARLNRISGSAVKYGASADYSGNRSNICNIAGKEPLNVSVAMLLDNYGLLDMSYYLGTDAIEQDLLNGYNETVNETESSAAETLTVQEEIVYLLDLVNGTTGNVIDRLGSNIVYTGDESGSYTFYHASDPDVYYGYVPHDWDHPEIQGDERISAIWVAGDAWISPNLMADMNKTDLDSAAWNTPDVQNVYVETYYNQLQEENICSYRIETSDAYITYEWYLDRGEGVESPASSVGISPRVENTTVQPTPSNNVSIAGYVIESSGGLKIRSGPATSYEEVGRLEPLEKVVVLEIQSDGTREWGRIDSGWVCMDYIAEGTPRTISTYDTGTATRDIVSGEYYDSTQNVGIKITTDANGEYLLSYSASGVSLNNIPLRFYNKNTPTDKMLMFDLGTYYPGYNGYVEFVVTGSSRYSYNSLIDGLADSYGDYFPLEKIR